jgi:hypothetical protein
VRCGIESLRDYSFRVYRMSGFVGDIALIDPVAFCHGHSRRSSTQVCAKIREHGRAVPRRCAPTLTGRFASSVPSNDVSWRHITDVM